MFVLVYFLPANSPKLHFITLCFFFFSNLPPCPPLFSQEVDSETEIPGDYGPSTEGWLGRLLGFPPCSGRRESSEPFSRTQGSFTIAPGSRHIIPIMWMRRLRPHMVGGPAQQPCWNPVPDYGPWAPRFCVLLLLLRWGLSSQPPPSSCS